MSSLTERIKAHYEMGRKQLKGPILVEEWGEAGNPLEIFFRQMNLAEQDVIVKHINDGSLKSLAATVTLRSLDKDGERLFRDIETADLFKHADSDVVSRICREMADESEDTPEKN